MTSTPSHDAAADTALAVRRIDSPVGGLSVIASAVGLRAVVFDVEGRDRIDIGSGIPRRAAIRHVDRATSQLDEYFDGERERFDLPLDVDGTEFQRAVWAELATVAFGDTVSYRDLASRLGASSARAVGMAVGRNPVPIVVPCHRVVGADGSVVGYVGGLDAKRWLLRHEDRRQPSLFDL